MQALKQRLVSLEERIEQLKATRSSSRKDLEADLLEVDPCCHPIGVNAAGQVKQLDVTAGELEQSKAHADQRLQARRARPRTERVLDVCVCYSVV